MPKDRGAEQGDVEGPSSIVWHWGWWQLSPTARYYPASCAHPWIGTNDSVEEQRLQAEENSKMQRIQDFQLGGSGRHIGADDPRHGLQKREA